jgi:hypothetical protein
MTPEEETAMEKALEALQNANLHHTATSLPLVFERFGSREAAGEFGKKTWNQDVPEAIKLLQTALGVRPAPAPANRRSGP